MNFIIRSESVGRYTIYDSSMILRWWSSGEVYCIAAHHRVSALLAQLSVTVQAMAAAKVDHVGTCIESGHVIGATEVRLLTTACWRDGLELVRPSSAPRRLQL